MRLDSQALYGSGARKVVVFGTGPIGCTPLARASNLTNPGQCLGAANELALGFNAALKQLVDALRVSLPGFNLVIANSFDTVTAMIADGKSFGKYQLMPIIFNNTESNFNFVSIQGMQETVLGILCPDEVM